MDFFDFDPNEESKSSKLFYRKMKGSCKRILRDKEKNVRYFLRINKIEDKVLDFTEKK